MECIAIKIILWLVNNTFSAILSTIISFVIISKWYVYIKEKSSVRRILNDEMFCFSLAMNSALRENLSNSENNIHTSNIDKISQIVEPKFKKEIEKLSQHNIYNFTLLLLINRIISEKILFELLENKQEKTQFLVNSFDEMIRNLKKRIENNPNIIDANQYIEVITRFDKAIKNTGHQLCFEYFPKCLLMKKMYLDTKKLMRYVEMYPDILKKKYKHNFKDESEMGNKIKNALKLK